MSFMNLDGGSGSAHIVERLVLERKHRTAKSLGFEDVDVDEAILQAAVLLFRDRQQQQYQQERQETSQEKRGFIIDSGRKQLPKNSSSSSPASNNNNNSDVKLEKLSINDCPANPFLEYLIEAAMGMDLFQEFELQGPPEELPHGEGGEENGIAENAENAASSSSDIFALDALGFRMRFSGRLRKLELINLPITRDHAESLMYGIETNVATGTGCRLDTLVMEGVRFVHEEDGEEEDEMEEVMYDGENENEIGHIAGDIDSEETGTLPTTSGDGTVVVRELCEGFPNNCTLKTIRLERCGLTDAQIALIFDSLAHHPTLTNINLSENSCRKLGLEALDRILVSPQWMPHSARKNDDDGNVKDYCKIESLDLSYQFMSEETYGTGEHIQLDILTRNCITTDADVRIYPNLLKLVLQGNQIDDSDMEDLAFLIRHRFPRLEELDLRFNEISTEGLEALANHSDPNNDISYINSKNGNIIANDQTIKYKDHSPPPSSRLRTIRLTNNPLVMTNQTSIVILKLLKIYPELTQIQSNLNWEDQTPIAQYIQHLFDINRAGRVLLLAGSNGDTTIDIDTNRDSMLRMSGLSVSWSAGQNNSHLDGTSLSSNSSALPLHEEQRRVQLRQQRRRPIPLAAWPFVLARLTRRPRYPHYIPKNNSLNGMYYLIRHGPIIMEQMISRSNEYRSTSNNITKKNSNNTKKNNDGGKVEQDHDRKRKWGDPALGGYETLADFLRCELGVKA